MGRTVPGIFAVLITTLLLAVTFGGCLEDTGGPDRSTWAFEMVGLEWLYEKGYRGRGVTIAIIDTGIDIDHPEFKELKLAGWNDLQYHRERPYDHFGHGTHVAGLIAAHGELRGGAYMTSLLVAQVFDDQGESDDDTVARAIDWAVQAGADIISLSLGGNSTLILGDATDNAAQDAIDTGVYVVAAAGNSQQDDNDDSDVKSPASVDQVIAVGAVDRQRILAPFSEHGDNEGTLPFIGNPPDSDRQDPNKKVELVAPGVKLVSAWKEGQYATASGTSMAVPFISAGIALLLEAHGDQLQQTNDSDDVDRLKDLLMDSAEPVSGQEEPHDDGYGYGLARFDRAYQDLED